jgi:Flp pilus assembly protein TadG
VTPLRNLKGETMNHETALKHKRILKETSILQRFKSDERGATLIMFAGALMLVLVSAGGAVDIGRRAMAKDELTAAVDSAALAACRAYQVNAAGASIEQIQKDEAIKYLAANFNWARYDIQPVEPTVTFPSDSTATASALNARQTIKTRISSTVTFPTQIMKIFGLPNLTVTAVSECTRAQGGIEVAMALDTTGSMSEQLNGVVKIVALRAATVKFINLLFGGQETSDYIRVNILPYSQTVNVGKLLQPEDFLTNPDQPSLTRTSSNWLGCILERPTNNTIGFNPDGSSALLNKDMLAPDDALDVQDFPSNTTHPRTGASISGWMPFLQDLNNNQQRQENAYVWGTKLLPKLNAQPDDNDDLERVTRWWLSDGNKSTITAYNNENFTEKTISTRNNASNRGLCPGEALVWNGTQTRQKLENDSTQTRTSRVEDTSWLVPGGSTYSDVGMMWGLRIISSGAPFPSAVLPEDFFSKDTANPYQGWVKAIVLMTDGVISAGDPIAYGYSPTGTTYNYGTNYTAYGLRMRGKSIYGSPRLLPDSLENNNALLNLRRTAFAELTKAHEQRLLIACKAARRPAGWNRAEDAIRVYTVFFGNADEVGTKGQLYSDCAGRDGKFINAQNETDLNKTFSNIASDLQNLRLSL